MNHIEPDHIMTLQNPGDPLDLPHVLVPEDCKLRLARIDERAKVNPTQYKGRNPSTEDLDRACNEAEEANRWYRYFQGHYFQGRYFQGRYFQADGQDALVSVPPLPTGGLVLALIRTRNRNT